MTNRLYESTDSCHPDSHNGVSMGHTLKFHVKVFYVMGKVLSGKLSYTWTILFFYLVTFIRSSDEIRMSEL